MYVPRTCTRIRCCLSGGWETNGATGEREEGREDEIWLEYGLINYGVQTAARLERERLVR